MTFESSNNDNAYKYIKVPIVLRDGMTIDDLLDHTDTRQVFKEFYDIGYAQGYKQAKIDLKPEMDSMSSIIQDFLKSKDG